MSGYGSIPQTEHESTESRRSFFEGLRSEMIAEFIGTCILVQVGSGANCVSLFVGGTEGMWQIAIVWILAATVGIYSSGKISGGHLNPAVTLSFALLRPSDLNYTKVVPYWLAQLAGAMVGAMINMTIFYKAVADFENTRGLHRGSAESILSASAFTDYWSLSDYVSGSFHAFVLEAFGTAFLVFTIFAVTNPRNSVPAGAVAPLVGVAIGSMVFLIGMFTNAGINPARDFGPRIAALIGGWGMASFTNCWVYLLAPLIGGPIGGLVADKLLFL